MKEIYLKTTLEIIQEYYKTQKENSTCSKNDILHGDELLSKKELSYLMESALKKNRPGFVKLLLENKFDLKHFMTTKRLYFLYHFKAVAVSVKNIFLYINWPYLNNYLFY